MFWNIVCYSYLFWIFIYLLLILFIFVKRIRCCGGARGWGWPFTWWHGSGISLLFTLFMLNQYYCYCNCCSCSMLSCSNLCYKLIILFYVCVLVIMFVCNEWVIIDKIKMTSMFVWGSNFLLCHTVPYMLIIFSTIFIKVTFDFSVIMKKVNLSESCDISNYGTYDRLAQNNIILILQKKVLKKYSHAGLHYFFKKNWCICTSLMVWLKNIISYSLGHMQTENKTGSSTPHDIKNSRNWASIQRKLDLLILTKILQLLPTYSLYHYLFHFLTTVLNWNELSNQPSVIALGIGIH